ncbi:hypothetical protein SteCoe_35961 [Stentor coeruleus]|uniref:Uncharacterized protein n=1 Tax=Stentor coeruleus TaxID=5963 RepID=A0A1R2AR41_9CILI|nr:hypothetical protein SteCoe_35961 [Stentor coeruleus]
MENSKKISSQDEKNYWYLSWWILPMGATIGLGPSLYSSYNKAKIQKAYQQGKERTLGKYLLAFWVFSFLGDKAVNYYNKNIMKHFLGQSPDKYPIKDRNFIMQYNKNDPIDDIEMLKKIASDDEDP